MSRRSLLGRFRDSAFRRYLNWKIKCYGTMTKLEIDTENKTISLDLGLKGESQPIRLTVSNYKLVENGKCTFMEVGDVTASREWMNALLAEPVMKETIKKLLAKPVPAFLKSIL